MFIQFMLTNTAYVPPKKSRIYLNMDIDMAKSWFPFLVPRGLLHSVLAAHVFKTALFQAHGYEMLPCSYTTLFNRAIFTVTLF